MSDLKVYNSRRGAGKTAAIIRRMRGNNYFICLVHIKEMKKFYPKELHDRIFTFQELRSGVISEEVRRHQQTRMLIDEGLLKNKSYLAKMYYQLGSEGWDVEMYCTDTEEPYSTTPDMHVSVEDLMENTSKNMTASQVYKFEEYMSRQVELYSYANSLYNERGV